MGFVCDSARQTKRKGNLGENGAWRRFAPVPEHSPFDKFMTNRFPDVPAECRRSKPGVDQGRFVEGEKKPKKRGGGGSGL